MQSRITINKLVAILFLFIGSKYSFSQNTTPYPVSGSYNFVRSWEPSAPLNDPTVFSNKALRDVKQTTSYTDGLGRKLQTVIKEGSLDSKTSFTADIVIPTVYDEYGRDQYQYLPFVSNGAGNSSFDGKLKLNPFQQQSAFLQNEYGTTQGESFFYGKSEYESSPLSKLQKSMSPGNSWVGNNKGVEYKYWFNTATDNVKMIEAGTSVLGTLTTYTILPSNPNYTPGSLFKSVIVDEKGKQVISFTDKSGNLILKKVQILEVSGTADDGLGRDYDDWICTYYIYDDFNRLKCVVLPEGVKALKLQGWIFTTNILEQQCKRYEYDIENRMVMKKEPGVEVVYMVYDSQNRLVMQQDGNMRYPDNKWLITKYDEHDRAVETGFWNNTTLFTNHISNASASSNYPQTTSNYELLTQNHYDDYADIPSQLSATYNTSSNTYFANTDNINWPYPQMPLQSINTKGLLTWSTTKILDNSNSFNYYSFKYDDNGQLIQSENVVPNISTDVITTQYSWAGQPLIITQKQEFLGTNASTSIVISKSTYDNLGRQIKIEKRVGNNLVNNNELTPYHAIASYEYDKQGNLKKQKLAPDFSSAGLENLNFEYNVLGWLLGMNRAYTKDEENNHFFGFDLGYDKVNNGLINNQAYATPQLDGNIAGIVWKSKGDLAKRKYDYAYDAGGRMLKADFSQYSGAIFDQSENVNYNVKMGDDNTPAYDNNGNIKKMQQWGLNVNSSSQIDNLSYSYANNELSNKLAKVSDNISNPESILGDFKDAVNSGDDYAYDYNGNLIKDENKKIVNNGVINGIQYNYLNLPFKVTITGKGTIEYLYNATGNKIQRYAENTENPGTTIKTTNKYINGLEYESRVTTPADPDFPDYTNVLQFITHEEGRIRLKHDDQYVLTGFEYDYFIKDHLNNIRSVITEENHADIYPVASLEDYRAPTEIKFYDIVPAQIVLASTIPGFQTNVPDYFNDNGIGNVPPDPPNITIYSEKLYRINSSNTAKTGLGITLKVMAGDKISVLGKSYYSQNFDPSNDENSPVSIIDILTGFLGGATGATATGIHGLVSPTVINTPIGTGFINSMLSQQISDLGPGSLKPKAFINVIFFDEQFKSVDFRLSIVGNNSELKEHLQDLQNISVNKNGFVYIYCSNESPLNVYFDNLQIVHTRGSLLEENSYYPFGLQMAAISSKAFGVLENVFKYQGEYSSFDKETGWNDFDLRNYDAQIGRFVQADPYGQFPSPYTGMGNNPLNNVDENGGWSVGMTSAVLGAVAGYSAPYIIQAISGKHIDNKGLLGIGGALVGAGIGYGIGESISNLNGNMGTLDLNEGHNGSTNFFANTIQFYSGLIGHNSEIWLGKNGYAFATTPDLFSWIPKYNWVISEILTLGGIVQSIQKLTSDGTFRLTTPKIQVNSKSVYLDNPKYKRIKFEPEHKSANNITILRNGKAVFQGKLLRGNRKTWRNRFLGKANKFEVQQTIENGEVKQGSGNILDEVRVTSSPRIIVKMKMKIN